MSTAESKIVVAIETLLRGMPKASRVLATFEKRLRSLADIKVAAKPIQTAQFDKASLAAQRLQQQQQRLAIQATELSNRQERARQTTERLAQAQTRLSQAQERATRAAARPQLGAQQDAQVRAFRAIEAQRLRIQKQADADNQRQQRAVESLQKQRSAAFIAEDKRRQQASESLQRQRSAALIRQFQEQEKQQERARKATTSFDKSLSHLGGTLSRIGSGISSAGRVLTTALSAPLIAIGVLATKNAVEFDSLRRGLEVMAGSAGEAEKQLSRLREIAKAPGIGFQEAIQGSIRLQAVGFSAEVAEKALVQFANAVALTGGGREELERITVQLGQLAAKGKVVAQDLKPIIEAGPAVGQALLQAFGTVNSEDIQKLGLSSQEFIDRLLNALGQLPRAAAGAKNAFENFTDSLFVASVAIGEALLPPITRLINTIEPIILQLADSFKSLSPEIQTAVVAVGALLAAAGPLLLVLGGLVTAIGGIVTGLGAIAGVISTIGLPVVAAALAAIAITIGRLVVVAGLLFKAWQANFLGIQQIVQNAVNAVLRAFNRIRAVFNEATQRILPTLQSITTKVLGAITAVWQKYGESIVNIVGTAFRFITRVTEFFLREFADFVDLVLKLIDGDFRGAWRAFARILVKAADDLSEFVGTLGRILEQGMKKLVGLILSQATRIAEAGRSLAAKFVAGFALHLVSSAPNIRDALLAMLIVAIASINPALIAELLVARLVAALRRAAAEGVTTALGSGETGAVDVGFEGGIARKKRFTPKPAGQKEDKQAASALRKAQKDFEQQQNEFTKQQAENRIALARTAAQQQFELTKDGLNRELKTLDVNFNERLVSIKKYFQERKRLQEAEIDAELSSEKALSISLADEFANRRTEIENEFKATVEVINRDPKLKGRAKDLELQTAEKKKQTDLAKALNDFETQNAEVSTRIIELQRKRKDVTADLTREEKELLKQIQKQESELSAELLSEQGFSIDATVIDLRQQFKDTLEGLRIDFSSLAPDLQKALSSVDLTTLKSRLEELPQPVRDLIDLLEIAFNKAVIQKQSVDIDRTLTELQLQETSIQNKVLDGVLKERNARGAILALQLTTKDRLLDILAAQLKIAESTAGQEDAVLRIRDQIQEVQRLGKAFDEVGQQVNQTLFSTIEDGFAGFFENARRGFDGLKDAATQFGNNLLGILTRLAAHSLTEQLFSGILKPAATETGGTPGGILAKLFGLAPKKTDVSAATTLATAGTTAGTALTTGGTAAGTAMATGGAAASATLVGGMTAAAASFAAAVTAAGAAFAASVVASAGAQSIGGLGSALGAATGLFPAVPGGAYKFVEGGYPEAVLTTDPRHAARQFQILRAYLKETRGLSGRIPQFAEGGFISPREAEMDLLSSITRGPSPVTAMPLAALANAGGGITNVRLRQILTTDAMVKEFHNSPEAEQVFVDRLSRNAPLLRRLTQRRS